MEHRKIFILFTVMAILLGILNSYFIMKTPKYNAVNSNYDIATVMTDLGNIAKERHTVEDQAALREVREYLLSRFSDMGIGTSVNSYTVNNWYGEYEINNILAQIEGNPGNPYILIMAHYDSVLEDLLMEPTKSTGAADDGYGVATLLQIAEQYSRNEKRLVNGIKFLITDSEETGPGEGSKSEVMYNLDFYSDVSMIINIEGRGFDGPVYMFQTSTGNGVIIDLYSKSINQLANSFFLGLFKFMPNFTDLLPFLEAGFSGMNFSTIGHLKYYHSDYDTLGNVNINSLYHYGQQIMPIVEAFTQNNEYSDPLYFKSKDEKVFFNLTPGIFLTYKESFNIVILLLSIILFIIFTVLNVRHKKLKVLIKQQLKLSFLLICLLIGCFIITIGISLITRMPLYPLVMFNLPFDGIFLTVCIIITILIMYKCLLKNKGNTALIDTLRDGILLNLIWSIATAIFLPATAYIFVLPVFISSCILLLYRFNFITAAKITGLFLIFAVVSMYTPIIVSLYYILTIGMTGFISVIIAVELSMVIPVFQMFMKKEINIISENKINTLK